MAEGRGDSHEATQNTTRTRFHGWYTHAGAARARTSRVNASAFEGKAVQQHGPQAGRTEVRAYMI